MFKRYIDYMKDNPKGYWFKRKIYGWGWIPVKWEGWFTVLVFVMVLLILQKAFLVNEKLIEFYVSLGVSIAVLIFICIKKGETPKWSWGFGE